MPILLLWKAVLFQRPSARYRVLSFALTDPPAVREGKCLPSPAAHSHAHSQAGAHTVPVVYSWPPSFLFSPHMWEGAPPPSCQDLEKEAY